MFTRMCTPIRGLGGDMDPIITVAITGAVITTVVGIMAADIMVVDTIMAIEIVRHQPGKRPETDELAMMRGWAISQTSTGMGVGRVRRSFRRRIDRGKQKSPDTTPGSFNNTVFSVGSLLPTTLE